MSNLSKDDQEAILDAFKQYLYAEDSSRNTTSAYLSDLAHFFTWYSQIDETFDMESITATDIRGYREFLQEQIPALSPATINRRLAALRRFFTWGDRPTNDFRISSAPYSQCGKHLSWSEVVGSQAMESSLTNSRAGKR